MSCKSVCIAICLSAGCSSAPANADLLSGEIGAAAAQAEATRVAAAHMPMPAPIEALLSARRPGDADAAARWDSRSFQVHTATGRLRIVETPGIVDAGYAAETRGESSTPAPGPVAWAATIALIGTFGAAFRIARRRRPI